LPIGVFTVMVEGRCVAWLTTCWAAAMFALLELPLPALALFALELLDEPQPAATTATLRMPAATPAARRIRLRAGVDRNMTALSSMVGVVVVDRSADAEG
jgi:hypothetical protein